MFVPAARVVRQSQRSGPRLVNVLALRLPLVCAYFVFSLWVRFLSQFNFFCLVLFSGVIPRKQRVLTKPLQSVGVENPANQSLQDRLSQAASKKPTDKGVFFFLLWL